MKIVKGIQMKVNAKDAADFESQVAGQVAIKDVTGFHSASFDEKEQKATFVYINVDDGKLAKGQKEVDVYVE